MLCFIPGHCTTTPPSTFLWHMVVDHFAVHYVSNWSNKPSFFCKNKFCLKICFSQNIQTLTERFLRTQPSKYIWWFDIQVVQFGQRIIYENSNQKHIHWTINSQGTIIRNSSLDTWFQIKINCLNLNVYSEGHESVNFTPLFGMLSKYALFSKTISHSNVDITRCQWSMNRVLGITTSLSAHHL